MYKAFAQYAYSIYKTRAEFYMPKNWDPQSEPANSDCVITINLFYPQYVFKAVCFCSKVMFCKHMLICNGGNKDIYTYH